MLKLVPSLLPYTELKAASYFSFLRGGSSPQEMLEAAFELGLNGLAIADGVASVMTLLVLASAPRGDIL